MARMYTFDKKLLCGSPEIRIGEKVYPVDDRKNTVKKAFKLFNSIKKKGNENTEKNDNSEDKIDIEDLDTLDKLFELAFGKNYKEIEAKELSFAAYNALASIVIAAMTGEDPEGGKVYLRLFLSLSAWHGHQFL